jgi:hypothetical protein
VRVRRRRDRPVGSEQRRTELLHLDASHIDRGRLDEARLPDTVARLNAQNVTFNPGRLASGSDSTWTFKTATDNAVATLRVSSEGTTVGATPNGLAQLHLNAQDEVPRPDGTRVGSNMSGYLKVAARTFNDGACVGTTCPDMMELYSDHDLRFTVAGTGRMSFVEANHTLFLLDSDGTLKAAAPFTLSLSSDDPVPASTAVRIDSSGMKTFGRNVVMIVTSGNQLVGRGAGGETTLQVVPLRTDGTDYGIVVEAENGVEYPLAVRSGGANRLLVCGNGGVVVGLDCTGSRGAGTITIAGDLFVNGRSVAQLDQRLADLGTRLAVIERARR